MVFSPLLVAALLPLAAKAANDWSKPCFGECNWDITSGTGSGTVRIAGPQAAVSDITPAAGWMIMDCDPNTADQDIRLVCQDPSKGCDHIYQNNAAGTLVRLPKDCGSTPFALVTREWVHQDQSIPASKRSQIVRRDGSQPVVKGMSLATSFDDPSVPANGNVSLFLMGSSIPGAAGNFTVEPPTGASATKRGLGSWVDDALGKLAQVHEDFSIGNFNKNISKSSALNLDKSINLFDKKIDCPQQGNIPGFTGEAKVDLDAKANGNVNYGVAAAGSIIPPQLSEFGLFVGLDTTITGTLGIGANITGSLTSGQIQLLTIGIPELDFPKILAIGPTFNVNAEATASIDANIDMDVDIAYTISGMQLFFPPGSNSQAGKFTPGDSNVKLAASPNVTTHGQVAAHLIPQLAFGLSALGGKTQATISLNLDADAALDLSLTAAAEASTSTSGNNATASVGGCVDISTGLNVNAGANADFFSLFKKDASVSLFQKNFDLFKKCFGSSTARRAYTGRAAHAKLARADGLSCPSSALGAAESVVDEKVSGSSLV
ncbi:hypothetical protein PYCCODRAFT_1464936 [Trametes coccinea BRFM310]|uniref:DUF7223 domain-containing protein n=1 Tax=Trametes coccinea (strain BRFM310) TaxID=1353009 RepID=A0A1Y2IWV8_TRAC3|nr:hypothetical protein PYCCODRAFT_1464936 [Trametes coccinea BRFM310]